MYDVCTVCHVKGPKQKGRKLRNSLIYCQKLLRNYLNVTKSDEMRKFVFKMCIHKKYYIFPSEKSISYGF